MNNAKQFFVLSTKTQNKPYCSSPEDEASFALKLLNICLHYTAAKTCTVW